jgi:heterodisulfide reductase subunit B
MNLKYSLFLGCIAPLRYPGIEASVRNTMEHFGVELLDMKGASCCPAPGLYPYISRDLWQAVAARNITIAEDISENVLTICNGCQSTLQRVNETLKGSANTKDKINQILSNVSLEFRGTLQVLHVFDVLFDQITPKRISNETKFPLKGLRVAPFYGCHYFTIHPEFGVQRRPKKLEKLIEAIGATTVNYPEEMTCCGAGEGVRSSAHILSLRILQQKLDSISNHDVDCLVVICPFCYLQFDRGQIEVWDTFKTKYDIPILYYTQLLGLSLGFPPVKAGLRPDSEFIKLLQRRGAVKG